MKAGRAIMIVVGGFAALIALGVLAAGGASIWAYATQRDDDGYYTTGVYRYASDSYAIATENVDVSDAPNWVLEDVLGNLRIRATGTNPETPIFLGVGPTDAVMAYLSDVEHDDVEQVSWPLDVEYTRQSGGPPPSPPTTLTFWDASVSGIGRQQLDWKIDRGDWTVVAMNGDGSAGVSLDADVGAKVGFVLPLGIGLLAGGVVLLGVAALLISLGARGAGRDVVAATAPAGAGLATAGAVAGATAAGTTAVYPVALTGELEPVSRWLWLVKWLLALPHWIVLAFLWIGFVVVSVIAFFAILFTGRYPRELFEFNVGVLRWTWRVGFYSYSALATDRYPPFTLAPVADYPADLHVDYPQQLSRGLVLVKSWLLAIPHLLIVALLNGGWGFGDGWRVGGIIGLLVLVAGVMLLFTGRYPLGLFDIVMGLNRWSFRVFAYVALMRDEYPPFRLDMGPREPGASPPAAAPATGAGAPPA